MRAANDLRRYEAASLPKKATSDFPFGRIARAVLLADRPINSIKSPRLTGILLGDNGSHWNGRSLSYFSVYLRLVSDFRQASGLPRKPASRPFQLTGMTVFRR